MNIYLFHFQAGTCGTITGGHMTEYQVGSENTCVSSFSKDPLSKVLITTRMCLNVI